MSPRQSIEVSCECEYVECVQYFSTSKGLLRRTMICRHPENAGCVCVLDATDVAECDLCPTAEGEEAKTEQIDVTRA